VDNWRRCENATDEMPEPRAMDVAKADALLGEMQKRHDWIMAPTDQSLANMVNSIGFAWLLGASPASAITNLTQTVQTTLPALGAAHGWGKASRVLGAAWRDAARAMGNMEKTLKNDEERRAFLEMQQRGDFSRTQAHTLAGLAEGNVLQTSPAWSRVMGAISWMFHMSEDVNREAAGMAAFRLARAEGKSYDTALRHASDVNANANFDYTAANRPRYMQGNVQRIALQFKNYSIGMTWLFYRNLFKAMKGEDVETRRVARRTVAGMLGMTALLAGATGLPVYNAVKMAANAANDLWGDDEPWNFDDAFHRWLADNLGQDAARLITEGPTNYFTGANLSSRTSMANLWIHDDSQRLEGADAYHALLENLAGPIGGITNNFYVGAEDVRRGHVQRGVERMLPTATKNGIKALRFAHEGVNNLRGDPIMPDVSGWQEFVQAIGFEPARLADQYRINTALKNYTAEIADQRMSRLNAYAMAVNSGDSADINKALANIRQFNARQPAMAITLRTLHASLRQRAKLSAQAQNGVILNRKLALQAQQYAGGMQ
ncbi:MAG: PLxRFG domain-containing protein, partial [Rhodanobacteraceae bacterium]